MSSENSETRTRILEATWKLLEERKAARMSDIAKQAKVSRQAVYLHFKNRSDLLIATTQYLDQVKEVDKRLAPSRNAQNGVARLDAFIDAWGNYIPEIYGVARALIAAQETDDAAAAAWGDRMVAVREGCAAAVDALKRDGLLSANYPAKQATDILWTLLSVRNWEQLTMECGWTQAKYIRTLKKLANSTLVSQAQLQ